MRGNTKNKASRSVESGTPSGGANPLTAENATKCEIRENERLARMVRTIEGEIVPRLIVARGVGAEAARGIVAETTAPDASDVEELVRLLLAHEAAVAIAFVDTVRERGAPLEAICVGLLAPAARHLGLLWERDECDFMQVTLALCRLHQVLREISSEFRGDEPERKSERRILLAPLPGEQHTFGVCLVAEFLERAGWEVWQEYPRDAGTVLALVRKNWFAVVGLSVGSDMRIGETSAMIRAIRAASSNRAIGILVGGPALLERPELVGQIEADGTAADGPQAVLLAEQFASVQAAVNL